MSPSSTAPKRARSSRDPWRPPRDRADLLKAIGAGAAVVLLSVGAVLFLGRDHLGGNDSTPSTPVPTVPAGGSSTTSTPAGTTAPTVVPGTPDSSAPQGSETVPPSDGAGSTSTLPGAPTP